MKSFDIARFDKSRSLFIEASAGTGKTYTIVEIIAKLILEGVPLTKLLVVTYTEKAAGELKDRIRTKIEGVLEQGLAVADEKKFRTALRDLNEAEIGTIHSFCNSTIKNFAYECHAAFGLSNSGEAGPEFLVDKYIRDEFPKDKNLREFLAAGGSLTSLREAFLKTLNAYTPETKIFRATLEGDEEPDLAKLCRNNLLDAYLEKIFEEWNLERRRNKVQNFNDMILTVRNMCVAEGSPLLPALRERFQYAIIDEFQDTNKLQWDIFKRLFLEGGGHSLWVVGDPKQSIYSFQGADLNVYKKAVEEIGHGASLRTNYRSTKRMIEACNKLFSAHENFGLESFENSESPDTAKADPEFCGQPVEPIWVAGEGSSKDFAEMMVGQIVEFCEKENGRTRLQISEKDGTLRDVKFSDFAILARTRSEMEPIERELGRVGLPFLRYKDNNLFLGRECENWQALLSAVDAEDFSGRNLMLLKRALLTDFFRKKLPDLEADVYENPDSEELAKLRGWHELAARRAWADLFEKLYEQSKIEEALNKPELLQSLAKTRQIGDYALSWLYENKSNLGELVRHLAGLSTNEEEAAEDLGLLAKGTDRDVIQVMTIHAAKGLEFPVVIAVAGFKKFNKGNSGPYEAAGEGEKRVLSFGKKIKQRSEEEAQKEWSRLFYVAYTRASELMILPRYEEQKKQTKKDAGAIKEEYGFLVNALEKFCEGEARKGTYRSISNSGNYDVFLLRERVRKILEEQKNSEKANSKLGSDEDGNKTAAELYAEVRALELGKKFPHATSYSQIAHGKLGAEPESDEYRNRNSDLEMPEPEVAREKFTSPLSANFPRGTTIGNAVHEIFEKVDYRAFEGEVFPENFDEIAEPAFAKEALNYKAFGGETLKQVWNTLHAKLPEMRSGKQINGSFSLCEIPFSDRKNEMQFRLNLGEVENGVFSSFCKGFIDLLFVRGGRYSILDWKTDLVSEDGEEGYSFPALQKHMQKRGYDIQRALYSYVLVKWLAAFHADMSEAEIFEKSFGGVYYAFFRGTKAGCSSGIYAEDFESWEALKASYEKIVSMYKNSVGLANV